MKKQTRKGVVFFEGCNLPQLRRLREHHAGVNTGRLKYLLPDCLRKTSVLTLDTNFADPLNSLDLIQDTLTYNLEINDVFRKYILKCEYGELKILEQIASEGGLSTQSLILKEMQTKKEKLTRRSREMECLLLNSLEVELTDEISLIQEIESLYGKIVSHLRRDIEMNEIRDSKVLESSRGLAQKVRQNELILGYRTPFRDKNISFPDLALFNLSRKLNSTILSTDGDMFYLSALSKYPVPICDCVEDIRVNEKGKRFQTIFGRYRVV